MVRVVDSLAAAFFFSHPSLATTAPLIYILVVSLGDRHHPCESLSKVFTTFIIIDQPPLLPSIFRVLLLPSHGLVFAASAPHHPIVRLGAINQQTQP